ncbi:hypothetical protein [Streptomyces sp. NPDC001070]
MTRHTSTSTAGRTLFGAAARGSRAPRGGTATAAARARDGRIVTGAAVHQSTASPCTGLYATAAGRADRRHDSPQEEEPP